MGAPDRFWDGALFDAPREWPNDLQFPDFPDIMEENGTGGEAMRRLLALLLILPVLAGCGKKKEKPAVTEGTVEEIYTFGAGGTEGT